MEPENILILFAELAIAIVGFSGIVAVLGQRAIGSWSASDIGRIGVMLVAAFRTLFAALLPFVFISFLLSDHQVWMYSSGIVGIVGAGLMIMLLSVAPSVTADRYHRAWFQRSAAILSLVGIGINLMNAGGIVFDRTFGPYLLSLMIGFTVSCMYFVRSIQTAMMKVAHNRISESGERDGQDEGV